MSNTLNLNNSANNLISTNTYLASWSLLVVVHSLHATWLLVGCFLLDDDLVSWISPSRQWSSPWQWSASHWSASSQRDKFLCRTWRPGKTSMLHTYAFHKWLPSLMQSRRNCPHGGCLHLLLPGTWQIQKMPSTLLWLMQCRYNC